MALATEKQYYTFVKGLITEASPLTFPENTSLAEDNFVLERTGTRRRRLGVNFEPGYQLVNSGILPSLLKEAKISFHKWDVSSSASPISIGVVRIANRMWFLNLLTNNPSANILNGGSAITINNLSQGDIDTTVVNSRLVVVSRDLPLPLVFSYNQDSDQVSYQGISVQVRDFWGVYTSGLVTERPASISEGHRYNLRNQNWSNANIDLTKSVLGVFPSLSDIWYLARNSDPTTGSYNSYNPGYLTSTNSFNSRAPKGAAILDAFFRGNSRRAFANTLNLPDDKETGAFSTIASYSGRLFYSGVASNVVGRDESSPNYNGYLFFTQVITSNEELGKCYQVNDPSAEDISDVVASDGGTIQIPEATKILKILPVKGSLLVFAENGIWEVFGGNGGFTATSFQVSKVSSIGALSARSVVEVNGSVFVWTNAGIFLLTEDQVSGRYQAENISLPTIQKLYNSIPEDGKVNSTGFYDERENKVRWLYNSIEDYNNNSSVNTYNKELILDLTLQAFSTNTFSSLEVSSPYICGYIGFPSIITSVAEAEVYVGNDRVLITGNESVVITSNQTVGRASQYGYLTLKESFFTISRLNNTNFVDWEAADNIGVDYESYLITGYEIVGDASRRKQAPYILCFFKKTESGFDSELSLENASSCILQAQWDWSNSPKSGKWGIPFQAYRFARPYFALGASDTFDTGEEVIVTKNKIRGSGKALSLKFSSEPRKDMVLLGWAITMNATGKV